ncbi:hypothetical protein HPB50_018356 [Hyalomma asiaticum]|uniref:Uncharacterized protein n=1 Tax=Hyalomma asiaticum TaxID=266040 RepID=A0ACB7T639_HYAAI|nr:hypothetical protein HPB50_018356 [Hyalomma asiaticum]
MSSYELPVNANEEVLTHKVKEMEGNLRSLNISNCIVACPSSLLWILSSLKYLRTLSCIACPLQPSLLLDSLLKSLRNLVRLEFSLVEAGVDATAETMEIWDSSNLHWGKKTNLREMYVEVMNDDNMKLLQEFVKYCPRLKDIHIYVSGYIRAHDGTIACLSIAEGLGELAMFTLSCEVPCMTQRELSTQPLDLWDCMQIHGNVVFRKSPKALSYALLRDLATSPRTALPLDPAVLVVVESPDLERQLLDAGLRYNWSELQSLCLLMFARELQGAVYPTVGVEHTTVLCEFFARLSNLVELNVRSFHFGDGVDFTELMPTATLQRLRALSLPPCGLRQRGAVRRLALGLGDVEELDIRLNIDGRHNICLFCDDELAIEPADTLLCPANALERLCILTTTRLHASKAEVIVASMARRLPSVFYLHIHYVDIGKDTRTSVTWIRVSQSDTVEEWSQPGKVMQGKPCIMCSTQTFVALPKPRCREL